MGEKFKEQIEKREKEPIDRLETIVYFIRHGSAESLPGADTDPEIDRKKHLSEQGKKEAEEAGDKIAAELQFLEPGDFMFFRSSPYPRAVETVKEVREKVIDSLKKKDKKVNAPTSVSYERDTLRFSLDSFDAYSVGAERRGSTKGLPEEWVRHPEILQQDLEKAGAGGKKAEEILKERVFNFKKNAAVWERAGRLLAKRWENNLKKEDIDSSEIRPPRLVILNGSHGGIVSEVWLYEAIKDYEVETGEKIKPELSYAEYFKVRFPSNSEEEPVLIIHGKEIPVSEELFKRPE